LETMARPMPYSPPPSNLKTKRRPARVASPPFFGQTCALIKSAGSPRQAIRGR
jgi:hypothetical protein